MEPLIRENVAPGTKLVTDEYQTGGETITNTKPSITWNRISQGMSTNTIRNFWSLLKRGIGGMYVSVEPFHLFRYDEQASS